MTVIGTLNVVGGARNQKLQVSFTNIKKQYVQITLFEQGVFKVAEEEFSPELVDVIKTTLATLRNKRVEFEEEGNQIKQIREQGQPWVEAIPKAPTYNLPSGTITEKAKTVNPDNFHNPYNFIPALPRDQVTDDLGDGKPAGHSYYHGDKYSGRIAVKLTTVTPLLIPDASLEEIDSANHKTYPVRIGTDGKPYLPPTSIKGMLRSAYEMVTNSRLGIFEDHDSRLAYRMPATMGLEMVPARIEGDQIILYPGTSRIGQDGKPQSGDPMYAAWLPRHDRMSTNLRNEVRYPDNSLPSHSDHVTFWAEKFEKINPNNGNQIFSYWRVRQIAKQGKNLGNQPNRTPARQNDRHQSLGEFKKFEGYVYITNKNIDNKHDERVFIVNSQAVSLPLDTDLKKKWSELITNYQEIHDDEIHKKGMTSPPALARSVWSRQVTAGKSERELKTGTLCYAHVRKQGSGYKVLNLYPVMITRGLYEMSPSQLLDSNLKPATKKDQLSPADRVFGWVNQEGHGSYKGQLRIHSVACQTQNAIDDFGSSQAHVPLAILGQPKPEQFRFYAAKNKNGESFAGGSNNKDGYAQPSQGLRGRKVYPHHKGLPAGYWENPTQDRTQQAIQGHYQEYRRPQLNGVEQKDDQNRSLKGWVKAGTEFTFDIDVINLTAVELGALLWLLALPDLHFHRLGGGKPLGFGSVRLDIDPEKTDLRSGEQWRDYYGSLLSIDQPNCQTVLNTCINAFQTTVKQAYASSNFDRVPFIAAFCRAAQGFNDNAAIHYPRIEKAPHPEGKAFEWFVANQNDTKDEIGLKLALSNLSDHQLASFPLHPKRPKQGPQNYPKKK